MRDGLINISITHLRAHKCVFFVNNFVFLHGKKRKKCSERKNSEKKRKKYLQFCPFCVIIISFSSPFLDFEKNTKILNNKNKGIISMKTNLFRTIVRKNEMRIENAFSYTRALLRAPCLLLMGDIHEYL